MAGPRWDELERSIRAKDSEAAERIWLELVEQDSGNIDGFLKAADGSPQPRLATTRGPWEGERVTRP